MKGTFLVLLPAMLPQAVAQFNVCLLLFISEFKKSRVPLLIATDVASRGLGLFRHPILCHPVVLKLNINCCLLECIGRLR